jgi:hypothetical protein
MNDDLKCFERAVAWVGGLVLFGLVIVALSSCNVTRTVTTTAQTIQRGDTTTTITTRTVEQYAAKVDASKLLQAAPAVTGL